MQLTPQGKKLVEDALTDKKWTLEILANESDFSISTVKRLSAAQNIRRTSFVTLCETLEIDWSRASEQTTPEPLQVKAKVAQSSNAVNPFAQRGMLGLLEDIYGRDREIRQVFEFLHSGSSVALVGETGLGSSSLLRAVELNAPHYLPDRTPIYLNMREILDAEDYYATLGEVLGIKFESQFQFQRELRKKQALLLLDGSEQLAQAWFTEGMRRQLRAWANAGDRSPIRLVMAVHQPLTQLFEDSGLDSPFANICHEITLKPWNADTIRGFIETRLNGTGVEFTTEEVDAIANESSGVPSQVMQCCYRIYEQHRED